MTSIQEKIIKPKLGLLEPIGEAYKHRYNEKMDRSIYKRVEELAP